MIERTFYEAGGYTGLHSCMQSLGFRATTLSNANFVFYPGGSDISPAIYRHKKHPLTSPYPSRDIRELRDFCNSKPGAMHVGICRGAQMLCALNGGILYQDVDNHAIGRTHKMTYEDEKGAKTDYDINSLHHQMMRPMKGPFQIWGTAREATYRDTMNKEQLDLNPEAGADIEILYFHRTRCLCFQAHPEYDAQATRYVFHRALIRAINIVDDKVAM